MAVSVSVKVMESGPWLEGLKEGIMIWDGIPVEFVKFTISLSLRRPSLRRPATGVPSRSVARSARRGVRVRRRRAGDGG